jgi:hypothetical protein
VEQGLLTFVGDRRAAFAHLDVRAQKSFGGRTRGVVRPRRA